MRSDPKHSDMRDLYFYDKRPKFLWVIFPNMWRCPVIGSLGDPRGKFLAHLLFKAVSRRPKLEQFQITHLKYAMEIWTDQHGGSNFRAYEIHLPNPKKTISIGFFYYDISVNCKLQRSEPNKTKWKPWSQHSFVH